MKDQNQAVEKIRLVSRPAVNQNPGGRLTLGQNIDQQILLAISGGFPKQVIRTKFVQMATTTLRASSVCYLAKNLQDLWLPADGLPKMGRLPNWQSFSGQFSEQCDQFASSHGVQNIELDMMEGQSGFLVPIRPQRGMTELFFVVAPAAAASIEFVRVLQKMASGLQLWLNSQDADDSAWQVQALSSIMELVSRLENQTTNQAAAEELANVLANEFKCGSVAVGLRHGRKLKLEAISGVGKIDAGSNASRNYLAALTESTLRKQAAIFPATDSDNNHLLHAHRQLTSSLQCEAAFSAPLITDDGRVTGAIIVAGSELQMSSRELSRFCAAAAPALANSLRVVNRVRRTRIRRATSFMGRQIRKLKVVAALAFVVGLIALMFLPVTYRVRCDCVTEPVTRRFAVAPFDGQIVSGYVEAGDLVEEGQLLAELDGRTIRWELSGVIAQRQQSIRSREIELTSGNIPKTILAELEYDRLASEESILEYKRDHLSVKSPIDGIVLSGSLDRAEAASVKTGQVLFEIGPLQPMRIEVAVPSEEVAQVRAGSPVKVWVEGQQDRPFEGFITRIHPRSETRDAKNVFVAEVEVPNEDLRLRPGMLGTVRIDGKERSLGWNLFHKPVNYLRSRLTWW